jgi:hypothetical protein
MLLDRERATIFEFATTAIDIGHDITNAQRSPNILYQVQKVAIAAAPLGDGLACLLHDFARNRIPDPDYQRHQRWIKLVLHQLNQRLVIMRGDPHTEILAQRILPGTLGVIAIEQCQDARLLDAPRSIN